MIPDDRLTAVRADAFVDAHQGDDDLNVDLASAMATYRVVRAEGTEQAGQVHARSLLRRAEGLGYDLSDSDPKTAKKSTAKKSTAKKTAKKS